MRERARVYSRPHGRIKRRAKIKMKNAKRRWEKTEDVGNDNVYARLRWWWVQRIPYQKNERKQEIDKKKTCCVNRASITSPSEHDIVEIVV